MIVHFSKPIIAEHNTINVITKTVVTQHNIIKMFENNAGNNLFLHFINFI